MTFRDTVVFMKAMFVGAGAVERRKKGNAVNFQKCSPNFTALSTGDEERKRSHYSRRHPLSQAYHLDNSEHIERMSSISLRPFVVSVNMLMVSVTNLRQSRLSDIASETAPLTQTP